MPDLNDLTEQWRDQAEQHAADGIMTKPTQPSFAIEL